MSFLVFEKTDEGRKAIQTRHVRLTPCQRAVLITVNGSQSVDELMLTATKMGGGPSDVQALIQLGLIATIQLAVPSPVATDQSVAGFVNTAPGALPGGLPASDADAKPPISMESLWPQSMSAEADAMELALLSGQSFQEVSHFEEPPEAMAVPDFEAAKSFALSLLQPLGLRAIQLRRTVEAANTPQQLRDVEHLIRDLLDDDQRSQLDSAFFGL